MKGEHLGELEELVLLAVQAASGDAYGVTVQQTIEKTTGRVVTLGAVYACLERLERKGFVESRVGGEQARQGGRRKRLFTLLPDGGDVLRRTREARDALWGLTEANDG
jgi:DNA-binding PadR family transcriptional regulator